MSDENETYDGASYPSGQYAYPKDLACFVQERWERAPGIASATACPGLATLEEFFSACYHASMVREEERLVTFRAILAPPSLFNRNHRLSAGLQLLDFSQSILFTAEELRRLSVAADPERTLICVRADDSGGRGLRIWGLINSGTRWLRDVKGGRRAGPPLPSVPVARVESPGSIAVYQGYELIARLHGGRLFGSRMDLFESDWLPLAFSDFRKAIMERHERARSGRSDSLGTQWASLEPTLPRRISERMMKRAIAIVREARHGGTIIFVPGETVQSLSTTEPSIDLKYRFAEGCTESPFADVVVEILNRLAEVCGTSGAEVAEPIAWQHFEESTDEELANLDEALFETAHLIAGLAAVDGAVVMSKRHELIGFGGMISGKLPAVRTVARALDLEGMETIAEDTGNVGARHRSAYRLVSGLPGSVAIVISQDGGVRFVCQKGGRVTYWEQE